MYMSFGHTWSNENKTFGEVNTVIGIVTFMVPREAIQHPGFAVFVHIS